MIATLSEETAMYRLSTVIFRVFIGWVCFAGSSPWVEAMDTAASPAASNQVWLISTRSATGCGDLEAGVPQMLRA